MIQEIERKNDQRNKTMTTKSELKKLREAFKEKKLRREDLQRQRDILTPMHEKCPKDSVFRKHIEQKLKFSEFDAEF